MSARLRLIVGLVSLCAWVVVGGVKACAPDDLLSAAFEAAIEEYIMEHVQSMPSLGGPTGIVSVPVAFTMPAGKWQAALGYQRMRASSPGTSQPADHLSVWSLQAVGRLSDTAEAWAALTSATDHHRSRAWGAGGKTTLTRRHKPPYVAVGASYSRWGNAFADGSWRSGDGWPDANVLKAYAAVTGVVAKKEDDFESAWLFGTAGVMHIRLDPDNGTGESLTRPFLGLQAIILGTSLGLEYRWEDDALDAKPVFSAAIRQWLSDELTAELGTTNASPVGTGLGGQRLFLRLSRSM